jgi:hypothetical protein
MTNIEHIGANFWRARLKPERFWFLVGPHWLGEAYRKERT